MTSSISVLSKLAVLVALISMGSCRPSSFSEEGMDYLFPEEPAKRLYFPVEVSSDAMLGALRAHLQSLRQPEASIFEQKRTTANMENLDNYLPHVSGDSEVRGMKRKMFWQPLGYLPASVRAHNNPPGAGGSDSKGSSSNVFRYGKK